MEYISIIIFILAIFIIGISVTSYLNIDDFLALPIGLAITIIFANVGLVTLDLKVTIVRIGFIILVSISAFYIIRKRKLFQFNLSLFYVIFLSIIIMLLPVIFGKLQFYVFRGNWWDHFDYLSGILSVLSYKVSEILNHSPELGYLDPILVYGEAAVKLRPSTVLVASIFAIGKINIFLFSYLYLVVLLSFTLPSIYYILHNIFTISFKLTCIITLCISIGFWYQFLIDTSVFSHITVLPLMFPFLAITLKNMLTPSTNLPFSKTRWMEFILFLAAFLVYPEGSLMIGIVIVAARLIVSRKYNYLISSIFLFLIVVFITAIIDFNGIIKFLWNQIVYTTNTNSGSKAWFMYYAQAFTGFDFTCMYINRIAEIQAIVKSSGNFTIIREVMTENPSTLLLFANPIPIAIGFYFSVYYLTRQFIVLGTLFSFLIIITLTYIVANQLRTAIVEKNKLYFFVFVLSAISTTIIIIFAFLGKFWEAEKLLTYTAPFLELFIISIVVKQFTKHGLMKYISMAFFSIWIFSSVGFAASRVYYASTSSGIGHPSPFPSILRSQDKVAFRYDIPLFIKYCNGITITEKHPNRALYLLLATRQYTTSRFDYEFTKFNLGGQKYFSKKNLKSIYEIKFERSLDTTKMKPVIRPYTYINNK